MTTSNCCPAPDLPCNKPDNDPLTNVPSCLSLILLPPRLLAASLSSAAQVVKKTFNGGFVDTCPSCHHCHDKHQSCCDIPETSCPSPIVCLIHWTGCPGDKLNYAIQVTNTAKVKRLFTLTPITFACTDDVIKLSTDKQVLLPDESLKTVATFTIPQHFGGGNYRTRIKVAGAYEQYILVNLTVHPSQDCCCVIEQGEIPKHIKAHHWYHHFQCEEPCFEAIDQATSEQTPSIKEATTKPPTTATETKRKAAKKDVKRG